MDSLTQVVLGAAVGEATLGKKVGNRAMMWGAIAGTIPDLDVYLRAILDDVTATELHRGLSHSLVFCVIMAIILGFSVHRYARQTLIAFLAVLAAFPILFRLNWITAIVVLLVFLVASYFIWKQPTQKTEVTKWDWTKLFFWGLVTHPLLDAHTTWGTQFFWPFEYRLAYKNIFVVDPLYTLPFLAFTLIALFKKRTDPRRSFYNWLGIIVSSSYMLLTFVFKGISYNKFDGQLAEKGIDYVEMDTRPTPFNTLLWNAQIETKTGYRMAYYSILDSKSVRFSEEFPKNHHLLEPYKDQKVVQQLIKISAGWYMIQEEDGKLYFVDLRFGQAGFGPNDPFIWKFELSPDENGQIHAEKIRTDMTKVGAMGGELWTRMWGN